MTLELGASRADEAGAATGAGRANGANGANATAVTNGAGTNGSNEPMGVNANGVNANGANGARVANRAQDAAERERVLRQALESRGQRCTEQRAAVYRYLAGKRTHPTADEVFTAVRAEIPDISLATVYKALEALVGCGLAVKLHCGDAAARYDGRTDPHSHAHCRVCGAVVDVPGPVPAPEATTLGKVAGFVVESYRVELSGRCASCG